MYHQHTRNSLDTRRTERGVCGFHFYRIAYYPEISKVKACAVTHRWVTGRPVLTRHLFNPTARRKRVLVCLRPATSLPSTYVERLARLSACEVRSTSNFNRV